MADCIPAGMEAFVATDDEQFKVIKKVIDLCDYYILVIGKRYGSINLTTGLSYTEMEYDYAREENIPILVFVIDDSVSLPVEKIETEPEKADKLRLFVEKAKTNRLVSMWKTSAELIGQLAIAIMRAKAEISRPGWQRGVDFDEASLRREIMELQSENQGLKMRLKKADETIESFTAQSSVAFENVKVQIDYYCYSGTANMRFDSSKTVALPELFSVISTEMMDVSTTESRVYDAIREQLFGSTAYYFKDDQLVKRMLNQFRALGLLYSSWSNEKSSLYWGLTPKGQKTRDDMILIRSGG